MCAPTCRLRPSSARRGGPSRPTGCGESQSRRAAQHPAPGRGTATQGCDVNAADTAESSGGSRGGARVSYRCRRAGRRQQLPLWPHLYRGGHERPAAAADVAAAAARAQLVIVCQVNVHDKLALQRLEVWRQQQGTRGRRRRKRQQRAVSAARRARMHAVPQHTCSCAVTSPLLNAGVACPCCCAVSSPLAYLARWRGSWVYTGPMSILVGTLRARSDASSGALWRRASRDAGKVAAAAAVGESTQAAAKPGAAAGRSSNTAKAPAATANAPAATAMHPTATTGRHHRLRGPPCMTGSAQRCLPPG